MATQRVSRPGTPPGPGWSPGGALIEDPADITGWFAPRRNCFARLALRPERVESVEVARRRGLVNYVDDQPAHAAIRLVGLVSGRWARAVGTVLEQVHRGAGPDYTPWAPGAERRKARS